MQFDENIIYFCFQSINISKQLKCFTKFHLQTKKVENVWFQVWIICFFFQSKVFHNWKVKWMNKLNNLRNQLKAESRLEILTSFQLNLLFWTLFRTFFFLPFLTFSTFEMQNSFCLKVATILYKKKLSLTTKNVINSQIWIVDQLKKKTFQQV